MNEAIELGPLAAGLCGGGRYSVLWPAAFSSRPSPPVPMIGPAR
jgi:hypothetical protein